MSERDEHALTPAERATRDAVERLARPRPDAAFRARLREDFVTGRIGRRRGLTPSRPWFARPALLLPLAAGFLAVAVGVANRGPDWRVRSADGEGRVLVDGQAFTARERAGLEQRLRRGGHVRVEGELTLDLVASGTAAVALAPGADLVLSPAPNRWWSRVMSARMTVGDAYFSTGRRFRGAHLDVRTPDAVVRAVGTSFAVLCEPPRGTCVCVLTGLVRVGGRSAVPGQGVDIPHGMRRVIRPNQVAMTLPILEDSVHRLHHQLTTVGGDLGLD